MLLDERVLGRFIFVITHYAPRLASGEPDRKLHGLHNADDFLDICGNIEKGAVLFGHVHRTYRVDVPETNIPLYCAGSATMEGFEGAWVYTVLDGILEAKQLYWNGESYSFEPFCTVKRG